MCCLLWLEVAEKAKKIFKLNICLEGSLQVYVHKHVKTTPEETAGLLSVSPARVSPSKESSLMPALVRK